MASPVSWTTVRDRSRRDAAFDRLSFEAVCLFSALGIVLTLAYLFAMGEALDVGLMGDFSADVGR